MNKEEYVAFNAELFIFWLKYQKIENLDKPFWWVKVQGTNGAFGTFVMCKN